MMLQQTGNNIAKTIFIFLSFVVCAYASYAQTTYKGVTLDRGSGFETNCIYVFNDNADSVRVFIQYKIGNRNNNWIDFPVPQLIPPSILEPERIGCVDSTIIGLNLVDVIIVKNQSTIIKQESKSNSQNRCRLIKKIQSIFSKLN